MVISLVLTGMAVAIWPTRWRPPVGESWPDVGWPGVARWGVGRSGAAPPDLWRPGETHRGVPRAGAGRGGAARGRGGSAAAWLGSRSRAVTVAAAIAGAVITLAPIWWWPRLLAGAVAVLTVTRLVRRARAAARRRRGNELMVRLLRGLIRELDAGLDPRQALHQVLPDDAAGPPDEDIDRIRFAWALSARHGIGLSSVLAALAADYADRAATARHRMAQTAGPAVSGYVLAALPLAGLLLGAGMGADPIAVLFGTSIGAVLLVAGTVLGCAGLLWADRIVRGSVDG